jgi:hypothetical protein
MYACANCGDAMASLVLEAFGTPPSIEISACGSCSLFWFDRTENIRLTPKAVLELFQYIGKAQRARDALASSFKCPVCFASLAVTQDLQRSTRFTYWRCLRDHGHLITFNQFLREKNFVRAPSPAELARLRATVRQIACSQCGAPVDLASESACAHCGAPIALIDPEGIAKTVDELESGSAPPSSAGPNAVGAKLSDVQIDAILATQRARPEDTNHDLVAIGTAAIGAILAAFIASR